MKINLAIFLLLLLFSLLNSLNAAKKRKYDLRSGEKEGETSTSLNQKDLNEKHAEHGYNLRSLKRKRNTHRILVIAGYNTFIQSHYKLAKGLSLILGDSDLKKYIDFILMVVPVLDGNCPETFQHKIVKIKCVKINLDKLKEDEEDFFIKSENLKNVPVMNRQGGNWEGVPSKEQLKHFRLQNDFYALQFKFFF
uniref:Uncharacterized protein n=1 Tax=Meloidogyne enterolobii TaxID=390850 RepID=A0A6V7UF00_MELEN|nr:unnamed protein product [Meloidogyne enterolobii]